MWIEQKELIDKCGVTLSHLRKARQRFREGSEQWEYQEREDTYFYKVSSIPSVYAKCIAVAQVLERKNEIVLDNYERFLKFYKGFEPSKAVLCAKSVCTMLEIISKGIAIQQASKFIESNDIDLPVNERRLNDKIKVFKQYLNEHGQVGSWVVEIVGVKRQGNQNARKYDDPELLAWLIMLRELPQNYTNTFIARRVLEMCTMTQKVAPSFAWCEKYLSGRECKEITLARFGKGRRGNWLRGYNPIEKALFSGDAWQMDGTRVNMIAFTEGGKTDFLYIVAVRDVHSGAVLGFSLGTVENRYMYIEALRMACKYTNYLPFELVLDKFPGHNTDEWQGITEKLIKYGTKTTYTSKATGKSQVERWFSTLQTVFMQKSDFYYGEGIQSRRVYAHRSSDYLVRLRKDAKSEGFDYDKAVTEMLNVLQAYNETKLSTYSRKYKTIDKSPIELHTDSDKPNAQLVQLYETLNLFGLQTSVKHRGGQLKIEYQGREYLYWIDKKELILKYSSFKVAYDIEDMNKVFLYDEHDRFLGEATEQKAIVVHGTNADWQALARSKANVKAIEDMRKQRRDEVVGEATLLMGGKVSKSELEAAESAFLVGESTTSLTRLSNVSSVSANEEEDFGIDIRNLY